MQGEGNMMQEQIDLEKDIAEVLIDEATLQSRISELAAEITRDYNGQDLLLVGALKGAVMFMVDLSLQIYLPLEMDFMAISSYGNTTQSSGVVRILKDLDKPIEGRNVLIVEDIVDSGLTLSYITESLYSRRPNSIRICALLNKPERRISDVEIDYLGFDIPDKFVVGYGLDYAERYRNLPYIGVLKPEVIALYQGDSNAY
jgi:hypoxanthine phosphoribosyltransferase